MPQIHLPSRNVIYQGDLNELLATWQDKHIMDGECAKLPQFLTDVGHTSRWQPGPRVVDLAFLLPGTVIANFVFDALGRGSYPNSHGYHAGLFYRFAQIAMGNGTLSKFTMIDQWMGRRPKTVSERPIAGFSPELAKTYQIMPCDNADEFYVVVVP